MEEKLLHQSRLVFEEMTTSAAPRTAVRPVDLPNGSVIIVKSLPMILKLDSPNQDIVMDHGTDNMEQKKPRYLMSVYS